MLLGHVVFAINLWMMRPGAFVDSMPQPEPEPERGEAPVTAKA
jgi:hypothetical protein